MQHTLPLITTDGIHPFMVPYDTALQHAVVEAVDAWQRLCIMPQDIKNLLALGNRYHDRGYALRTRDTHTDDKEFCHVSMSLIGSFAPAMEKSMVVSDFVHSAATLLTHLMGPVGAFAHELEAAIPSLVGLERDTAAGFPDWTLRFLHYFPNDALGTPIALPHPDRGGYTLHLYESAPGLEWLSADGRWHPVNLTGEETAIFTGMGLQRRSQSQLRALSHRVVATKAGRLGRYSCVCFIEAQHMPIYDGIRHGSLQAFPPGFNYTMPPEEFEMFF